MLTPGSGVIVDVHAAGVSFPEVLQTRGEYQVKPPLPFVPGSEVGGIVRSAPADADVKPGDRVAAFCMLGGFAEVAVAPGVLLLQAPRRARLRPGRRPGPQLPHRLLRAEAARAPAAEARRSSSTAAAGGVGTASLQVAKGLGATTIAVVSSDEKERVAAQAGADHVLRSDGPGRTRPRRSRAAVSTSCSTRSAATGSPTACARCARAAGWSSSASPAARSPRSRSTACCSTTPRSSAPAGAPTCSPSPRSSTEIGTELEQLIEAGFVAPVVGARYPLERAGEALALLDERGATGKVVLEVG